MVFLRAGIQKIGKDIRSKYNIAKQWNNGWPNCMLTVRKLRVDRKGFTKFYYIL